MVGNYEVFGMLLVPKPQKIHLPNFCHSLAITLSHSIPSCQVGQPFPHYSFAVVLNVILSLCTVEAVVRTEPCPCLTQVWKQKCRPLQLYTLCNRNAFCNIIAYSIKYVYIRMLFPYLYSHAALLESSSQGDTTRISCSFPWDCIVPWCHQGACDRNSIRRHRLPSIQRCRTSHHLVPQSYPHMTGGTNWNRKGCCSIEPFARPCLSLHKKRIINCYYKVISYCHLCNLWIHY